MVTRTKREIDDHGDYKLYRDLAREATDPTLKRCAEKAALYYSDSSEASAVPSLKHKAAQYRSQARSWGRRYWARESELRRAAKAGEK